MSEDQNRQPQTTHLTWRRDADTGDLVFAGRLRMIDVVDLNLDGLDRAVIEEPVTSAADLLQSLELIFRRLHQQREEARRRAA